MAGLVSFGILSYIAGQLLEIIHLVLLPGRLTLGLLISVHIGALFTFWLNWAVEEHDEKLLKAEKPNVPSCLTGYIERFIFTVVIALVGTANLLSVGGLMGGWLGLKLAANWQQKKSDFARARGILALINGLTSMFFAFLGGLIASTQI